MISPAFSEIGRWLQIKREIGRAKDAYVGKSNTVHIAEGDDDDDCDCDCDGEAENREGSRPTGILGQSIDDFRCGVVDAGFSKITVFCCLACCRPFFLF